MTENKRFKLDVDVDDAGTVIYTVFNDFDNQKTIIRTTNEYYANQVYEKLNLYNDEINDLKDRITEIKQDEHQLSLSFLEYKQKVTETLQKVYDNPQNHGLYSAQQIEEIAEKLGVELE